MTHSDDPVLDGFTDEEVGQYEKGILTSIEIVEKHFGYTALGFSNTDDPGLAKQILDELHSLLKD